MLAGDTLLPLSLPTERGWHSITQVGKYSILFGGVRFKDHRSPEPFASVPAPGDVECLADLFIYDTDNVSWHKVSITESTEGEGINWPCGRYGEYKKLFLFVLTTSLICIMPTGHSACGIDKYHMLLFGGRTDAGRYLADTWIFSLLTLTWRRLHSKDLSAIPSPRAFTALALSVSTRSIFLYGGTNGTENFGDVWMFQWGGRSFSTKPWQEWEEEQKSMAAAPFKTYNHEGEKKDDNENIDSNEKDQETFKNKILTGFNGDIHEDNPMAMGCLGSHSGELYWTRGVTVSGSLKGEPEPRFGHRLVAIPEGTVDEFGGGSSNNYGGYDAFGMIQETKTTKLRNGTFLAVIGGCCVSPRDEINAQKSRRDNALPTDKISELLHLAQRLQAQYTIEGEISESAGNDLLAQLEYIEGYIGMESNSTSVFQQGKIFVLKDIHHRAARITATLALMEQETRALETEFASSWYDAQAMALNATKHGMRQSSEMDVHFLCADDVAWVPQINPRISGLIPASRMHFGAVALGNYIFVIGGVQPTSLSYKTAEINDKERLVIHALDVTTLEWFEPKSMGTSDYLEGPIRVAQKDIVRAEKRVEVERSRGLALGRILTCFIIH